MDGWDSVQLIDATYAMLIEPVLGDTEGRDTKLTEQLEAFYEGSEAAKRKVQADLLAQFGMSLDGVRSGRVEHSQGQKPKRRTARRFGGDRDDARPSSRRHD